jgi:predicted amidophosphoribosyltransferase
MKTSIIRSWKHDFQQLLLPMQCVECGAWGSWLCSRCRIRANSQVLERQLPLGCDQDGFLRVSSAMQYRGVGERVILAYKERSLRSLADVMASWLVRAVEASAVGAGPLWLVPVPGRSKSQRRRGYDHLLGVCELVSAKLGSSCATTQLLAWRPRVRIQKRLSRGERARNVSNQVFVSDRTVAGLLGNPSSGTRISPQTGSGSNIQVILVDDVVTTGATLSECHRALSVAGVSCERAATVCTVVR